MKTLLLKFILGRGLNKLQELTSKWVRHGIGAAGGAVWMQDHINSDQLLSLEGGALVLVSVVWSMLRAFLDEQGLRR